MTPRELAEITIYWVVIFSLACSVVVAGGVMWWGFSRFLQARWHVINATYRAYMRETAAEIRREFHPHETLTVGTVLAMLADLDRRRAIFGSSLRQEDAERRYLHAVKEQP